MSDRKDELFRKELDKFMGNGSNSENI